MSYNGWPNYATWNVALWFGNDEPLYRRAQQQRRSVGEFTAENVEAFVRETLPHGTPDITAAKYQEVAWKELAEAFNEF